MRQGSVDSTSAWNHAAALIGGLGAFLVGAIDLFAGQHLTAAGDLGFMVSGLGALGVKATGVLG